MHRAKTYPKCGAPGCNASGNVAHGLCQLHYGQWRLARRKNAQDLLAHSEIPPFEYEGDEQMLVEMTEQQEREKAKDLKGEKNGNHQIHSRSGARKRFDEGHVP